MGPFLSSLLEPVLVFAPLAVAVFISYRILRITDLSVEGSFVLGAVVMARLLYAGFSPAVSTIGAVLAGGLVGFLVAMLQRDGRLSDLLTGILFLFILQSVNLLILGQPSQALFTINTPLQALNKWGLPGNLVPIGLIVGLLLVGLFFFLKSCWGLRFRAFGVNPILLREIGHPLECYRMSALVLSGGLAAFSGVLTACVQGYVDVTMGLGLALIAIAAVMIGQAIRPLGTAWGLLLTLLGITIYFFALNWGLRLGLNPLYLKLILGLGLALVLMRFKRKGA